jgi:hypothetical protein
MTEHTSIPAAPASVIDSLLNKFETTPRPWFLKASDIYTYVKSKLGISSVETLVTNLDKLILAINTRVIHVTVEDDFSFVSFMDAMTLDLLTSTDVWIDSSRTTIAEYIRKVKNSVISNAINKKDQATGLVSTVANVVSDNVIGILGSVFLIAGNKGNLHSFQHALFMTNGAYEKPLQHAPLSRSM